MNLKEEQIKSGAIFDNSDYSLEGLCQLFVQYQISPSVMAGAIEKWYELRKQQAPSNLTEYNRGYNEGYADALDQHGMEANPDLED